MGWVLLFLIFRENVTSMKRKVSKQRDYLIEAMNKRSWQIWCFSFIFKVTNNQYKEVLWRVIYRDDSFLVFKVNRLIWEIRIQRDKFQNKVDGIERKYYLQFTCDNWNPGGRQLLNETKTTSMITKKSFPLLDLGLFGKKIG